jgi:hypothetical protein
MAAFTGARGTVRLVRNHEVHGLGAPFGGGPYDRLAGGGTTTLVFDPSAGRLLASFPSLAGTAGNCAGGRTPWGSWLSCEEGTAGTKAGFTRPHGYVFEVPAQASAPQAGVPLRAMGRFVHEAVAVDPSTSVVYLTEDRQSAGFYRFVPDVAGVLTRGRLQMLAIVERPGFDTRWGQDTGRVWPTRWVDIADADPDGAEANPSAVFDQGRVRGGAVFRRLEGCCWAGDRVLLNATEGGDSRLGQLWEYRPGVEGSGSLRLLFESPGPGFLRHPDNVTVSPRGGILLCEDADGTDRIMGVDPTGRVFEFARNRLGSGEFAGVPYGPAGRWLYFNIQRPGLTLGITGCWERGCL